MDFKKLEQELRADGRLEDAMNSPEGRRLAGRIDNAALSDAAKRGDTAALKSILSQVLSTPEGKALAQRVQKAVGQK